MAQNVIKENV